MNWSINWWKRLGWRETAQKVADFLQEHASDVPRWLAKNEMIKGLIDKFGLGNVLGTE
jgi:hypothetical protein